eukprot:3802959-Prymnesium_polylepis.1
MDAPRDVAPGGSWTSHQNQTFTEFAFTFVDAELDEPVRLNYFHLSFFDLDTGSTWRPYHMRPRECIGTRLHDAHALSAQTDIVADSDPYDDSFVNFCGSQPGVATDNPHDPLALSDLERRRSIRFEYSDTYTLRVRMFITCCSGFGRNFLFAGGFRSEELCPQPPAAPPTPTPPPASPPMPMPPAPP